MPTPLNSSPTLDPSPQKPASRVFRLSPIIRATLILLYVALTIPLPFLAEATQALIASPILWSGLAIGLVVLYATLTERVVVDADTIQVTYPTWVRWFWRKGWSLSWSEIKALKPRTTGQGGLVYYFLSQSGQAYLLPMRIVGFAELVRYVQTQTGIDTRDVKPLAQPWMYLILLGLTLLLLAIDCWTIMVALGQTGATP